MRHLSTIGFLLLYSITFAQRFELTVGITPTHSFTGGNLKPDKDYKNLTTVLLLDPHSENGYKTTEINYVELENYFSLEPSIEIDYNISKNLTVGLGFFGRKRRINYDVYFPGFTPTLANRYDLHHTLLASTLGVGLNSNSGIWSVKINAGFSYVFSQDYINVPINQMFEDYLVETTPLDLDPGVRLRFSDHPLLKFTITRSIAENFSFGIMCEKQFNNPYGTDVRVVENLRNEDLFNGRINGNEISLGIKLAYTIPINL